jgi:UDP-N-acetylmuramate dehydrogenase
MTKKLIETNVPLANKNWFGTGGSARFFAEPETNEAFQEALLFAHEKKLPILLLGLGANMLVSDEGFDGLVIRPALKTIQITTREDQRALVTAGAGVTIDDLIQFCLSNNLIGLEELTCIPGTVGGSVFINIHYFQFFLSQFMVSAEVIERSTGIIQKVDTAWFNFGYDTSRLHSGDFYLLNATFALKPVTDLEAAYARGRSVEIDRHRRQRYPYKGTCGSFFRNFHENEVTLESNGKKMIFVAYYLDKLGVKGELSCGGAIVSYQHANMIVNRGNATSADIVGVARLMQEKVRDAYGIVPQPECQLVGFKTNPLL